MTKEFVPYEQALQLKELGFDEECLACYFTTNGENWEFATDSEFDVISETLWIGQTFIVSAPLYQQAFRWFRKKYGLQSFPDYTYYDGFHYGFKWVRANGEYGEEWKDNNENSKGCDTPEEAELACLIKLIEIVKNK
jgi:hypothetical protein